MSELLEPKVLNSTFLNAVLAGFASNPKSISSKYFYDKKGDELFQQIMHMEEYYLTNAEHEIFSSNKTQITDLFSPDGSAFNLIEFGAGDCYKTKVLLKEIIDKDISFDFVPIDISQNVLDETEQSLADEIPALTFNGVCGDYFDVLHHLKETNGKRNIVLFLGSNIGNFTNSEAHTFLSNIQNQLNPNDLLMIGFDIKKDPSKILKAYNDKAGITRDFNLNLLERINNELEANIDIDTFEHHPTYDPVTGECKSALLSKIEQDIYIQDQKFHFEAWEPIHTEISRKYSIYEIKALSENSGFEVSLNLFDKEKNFVDSIWKVK